MLTASWHMLAMTKTNTKTKTKTKTKKTWKNTVSSVVPLGSPLPLC